MTELSRALIGPEGAQIAIAFLYFLLFEIAILGDYLFLGVRCFASVAEFNGYARPILRVLQLVFITVIIFAAVHYYIAALSHEKAYQGLTVLTDDQLKWWGNFDRLTFIPSWDTVIDAVYFSTVTMATVGYGDILPVTKYAKIATIVQIIFSFVLVVVLLGWAIGNAKELASRQQKNFPVRMPGMTLRRTVCSSMGSSASTNGREPSCRSERMRLRPATSHAGPARFLPVDRTQLLFTRYAEIKVAWVLS